MGAAIFDRILLLLLSALAAFIALVPMAELGWFGSSFEGSIIWPCSWLFRS